MSEEKKQGYLTRTRARLSNNQSSGITGGSASCLSAIGA